MIPDGLTETTELQTMSGDDDDTADHHGTSAPLLSRSESPTVDTVREDGYTGGRFIWALTFSAGVSGLLFGYEYVPYPIFSLVTPRTEDPAY